ncbi:STAS domain-containing protein [Natranaerofaba carboxydovora]|uniref:STAS domain-containing protein n=1 Tax=Natranaerofaba carboxydovora TaxID=2742683 RepID=UPI001F1463D7|nr:STAS domain-containing protein [Natranaerofaba carboxydovora]UMZ74489.1 Putative anti-sigma factor antagonist [Natranaerofaba carboxydovora]
MKVEKKEDGSVLIIPEGKIDITNSSDLKETLLSVYNEGYDTIIIDFEKVYGIDSSGLGKLLLIQKKLSERNGKLKIINVTSDYVNKMFSMIHLNKVIEIEDGDAKK